MSEVGGWWHEFDGCWLGRTSAQSTEVLCSLWHSLAKETHHNAAQGLAINLNVEEHLGGDLGALSVKKSYKVMGRA